MALSMPGAPINKNLAEVERELVSVYGFVPELFRAQGAEPHLISAEARLLAAILLAEGRLTRRQKEVLLSAVASARGNEYCWALHAQAIPPDDPESRSLLDFAAQLASYGLCFSARDIEALMRAGFHEQAILEAVATTALGQMLCVLATAIQPSSDPECPRSEAPHIEMPSPPDSWEPPAGPYLKSQPPPDFEPFAHLARSTRLYPQSVPGTDAPPCSRHC